MSPFEPWLEYLHLFRHLEEGGQRFVEVPDPRVRNCMHRLKLRPTDTPEWGTVPQFLGRLDVDVAAACARLAIQTAMPFVAQLPVAYGGDDEDGRAAHRALEWARGSALVALNLESDYGGFFTKNERTGESRWHPSYVWADPPFDERMRREAAIAAVLASADAVALATTGNPFEVETFFDFIPRVETGKHVDMVVLGDRHLVLVHDRQRHVDEQIEDFELWDLGRLIEDWMESGWGVGTVDELGAMSNAPYIAEEEGLDDDDVRQVNTLWYFHSYAVHSEIQQLQEEGRTGPWTPFIEGGEAVGNWPPGALSFWTGESEMHRRFFRLWWKRCLCVIPASDIRSVSSGTTGGRRHTVAGLIARPGTEYEAVVTGDGPVYTISVTDGDEYSTLTLQDAFLNQRGLAYPTNLIKITGHETTPKDESPLDRRLGELVADFPDIRRLEEVPTVPLNPIAALLPPEAQESAALQFSRPAFATVRRKSSHSASYIARDLFDAMARMVQEDVFDRVDLTMTGTEGITDLASEVGPRGSQRELGEYAEWQLNEGRLRGFWMQQLAAYPALQRWVLRGLGRDTLTPVPPMDPGSMTLEEAVELAGYQRHEMLQPILEALSGPDEVWRLQVLDRFAELTGADRAEFGAPAHRLHQAVERVWHWMAAEPGERAPLFTALYPTDFSGDVYEVLEATGYGADYLELRRLAADALAEAADFFVEHLDQQLRDPSVAKWGFDRRDALRYAEHLSDVLDPDALAAFESIRLQLDEAAERLKQERRAAAYRHSLAQPRNNLAWIKVGSGEQAIPLRYNGNPGEEAREKLPEIISRDENGEFVMRADESEEMQEYSMEGVEERPSERIEGSTDELIQDAEDLDPEDWETFLELQGIELPEDDERWEALLAAAIERLRTDKEFQRAWLDWRVPELEEEEEEESWRYEPDRDSHDYQVKLYEIASELAEEAAFDEGYALIEWIEPYRQSFRDPEPTKVYVRASAAVPRSAFIKLIDDIVAVNRATAKNEDGSLIDTDEIDLEHPEVNWSGTVYNYVNYARRGGGDLASS